MKLPRSSLRGSFLTATFLSGLQLSRCGIFSSSKPVQIPTPDIRVGLKAAWNAGPFLLELLETAALEEPESYFPLLDVLSKNPFSTATTDEALYTAFLKSAQSVGYFTSPSAFDFALSIRAAAPRIEAHYQYYNNTLLPDESVVSICDAWTFFGGLTVCGGVDNVERHVLEAIEQAADEPSLPFDRISKNAKIGQPVVVVYADVTTEGFRTIHKEVSKLQEEGRVEYRLRYKPSKDAPESPVMLSGYGVELVLKKSDYMVMDDRGDDAEVGKKAEDNKKKEEEADEKDDITPVHPRDLKDIGLKAATYILNGTNNTDSERLATLNRILQDFPMHGATLAAVEVDAKVLEEYTYNRKAFPVAGGNAVWINGQQIDDTDMNAFALADIMRKEKKTVTGLMKLGLSSSAAVSILSHKLVAESGTNDEPQRFDWRETEDETGTIVWLNNLEKDKRYEDWPNSVSALTRQVYPGQIHTIAKNIHHLVLPLSLTDLYDVETMTEQLQMFVQRMIALRFGVVPIITNEGEKMQAKAFYHLKETYGLGTALQYFQVVGLREPKMELDAFFLDFVSDRRVRKGQTRMTLPEILESERYEGMAAKPKAWSKRLAVEEPTLFINGIPLSRGENWVQTMSQRLMGDVQLLQRAAYSGVLTESHDLAGLLLGTSPARTRNILIFPESDADMTFINVATFLDDYADVFSKLPYSPAPKSPVNHSEAGLPTEEAQTDAGFSTSQASIWVIGDFDQASGLTFLANAFQAQTQSKASIGLTMIHNPEFHEGSAAISALLAYSQESGLFSQPDILAKLIAENAALKQAYIDLPHVEGVVKDETAQAKTEGWAIPDKLAAGKLWDSAEPILSRLHLHAGDRAVVINGRVIGPLAKGVKFEAADFEMLVEFELIKRIKPILEAATELGVDISGPHTAEKLTSVISSAAAADVPAGLFDKPVKPRAENYKLWQDERIAIITGDNSTAVLHIIASLDPATEIAQKWAPILTVLSEMEGVYLKIYLNPDRGMTELPVKRFYRHVLHAKPSFNENGTLSAFEAVFTGIPSETLVTLGMDIPPSWLVAPVISYHDLDNIKLKTFKDRFGSADITALYGLTHILIEGHSRDLSTGQPPRGVQIVLGTKKQPAFAGTIIMANLGYFQFKANPGFWTMGLKEGRSREIFSIDSTGIRTGAADDTSLDIVLMSFKGITLFPRLSRNDGMETEDVLEQSTKDDGSTLDKAKGWLQKIGVVKKEEPKKDVEKADINVFSVASGHLYERFLNIMMVSVMRHTEKKVKFWFIENFLSPSFKDFIPIMAAQYNFQYELITYKWPHWLRAQKEKQREIWGYKILFLDVLFPLDLDKVIFVDADQIVRTDLQDLNDIDLEGAPYGFTPMGDSRTEMEGFRFWKQGYWKNFLKGTPYHISALYVVDLVRFRQIAAGDRLRQTYHQLSADPNSLANLDQDLPNHMQMSSLPIHSLPQDWLWCETWCSDESLKTAKTIDLCNNPMTKEPKLDRARRQVPEWTEIDDEVAGVAERWRQAGGSGLGVMREALVQKEALGEEEKVKVDEKVTPVDDLPPVAADTEDDGMVGAGGVPPVKVAEQVADEVPQVVDDASSFIDESDFEFKDEL